MCFVVYCILSLCYLPIMAAFEYTKPKKSMALFCFQTYFERDSGLYNNHVVNISNKTTRARIPPTIAVGRNTLLKLFMIKS